MKKLNNNINFSDTQKYDIIIDTLLERTEMDCSKHARCVVEGGNGGCGLHGR